MIPIGHPNRPGVKLERIKAIVIHYTANDKPGATDTANANYFGRKYVMSSEGPFEADLKTTFRYGSAQIICDQDSITVAIPEDEVAWGCGDRPMPYTSTFKGQQPLARQIFGNRQNYQTVSVEICNNGDWGKAVANASEWVRSYCKRNGMTVDVKGSLAPQDANSVAPGTVLVVRHYDVTGKMCPRPFVDDHGAWVKFVEGLV